MLSKPECHYLTPTPHVPNSVLPVLVYRSALPSPTPASMKDYIETNHWIKGGQWKAYPSHHFHSVTHECYAIFKGRSTVLLGRGPLDDKDGGIEVELTEGDVIVLPAGVSHCSIFSEDDYEYLGLYPEGSPHWDNNFCKAGPEETAEKAATAKQVPVPEWDPVFGKDGPLVNMWREALEAREILENIEPGQ